MSALRGSLAASPELRRRGYALAAGASLLAALALALAPGAPRGLALAGAGLGCAAAVALLAATVLRTLRRHLSLLVLPVLAVLIAGWVTVGLHRASRDLREPAAFAVHGVLFGADPYTLYRGFLAPSSQWPWRFDGVSLLPLALAVLAAAGGVVLLADAVRLQLGLLPRRTVPWRVLSAPLERRGRIAWRALPGVVLVGAAAFLGIGLANGLVSGDPLLEALVLLAFGGGGALLVAAPVVVGTLMRLDRDQSTDAQELERLRFAAHLHDSVLQTLALVQRQAHDPAAVIRLARRQEHALRAWMAGEAELVSETLAAALRDAVAEVEDECDITVELTVIGDRPLCRSGEALVAAAREALRNAGRHASGAPVFVFGEIDGTRVEVFVRDDGPGFRLEDVAPERRGIRDAVIGRMTTVGGRAVIESAPGSGTEVALVLDEAKGR